MESTSTKLKDKLFNIYKYDGELAIAFQSDCETFLTEFKSYETCSYEIFARLWREMQFTSIFEDQKYTVMLKTFTENCFFIIKKFLIYSHNIYIQVGALYLLYGVFYKQPVKNWVKIRLTSDDYKKLIQILNEMKQYKEYEVLYIVAKLMSDGAFQFVAIPQPLGPDEKFVKRYDLSANNIFTRQQSETSLKQFKEFYEQDVTLNNFDKTNHEYEELKRKCLGVECRGLPEFQSNFLRELKQAYSVVNGGECSEDSGDSKGVVRAGIKRKAMQVKSAVYRGDD